MCPCSTRDTCQCTLTYGMIPIRKRPKRYADVAADTPLIIHTPRSGICDFCIVFICGILVTATAWWCLIVLTWHLASFGREYSDEVTSMFVVLVGMGLGLLMNMLTLNLLQ